METFSKVLMTTLVDKRNTLFTREALDSAAACINESPSVVPICVEHDRTIPPLGHVVRAWVEPLPNHDGHYQLVTENRIFEERETLTLKDGTVLCRESSHHLRKPFRLPGADRDKVVLTYDMNGFQSEDEKDRFLAELRAGGTIDFDARPHVRRSLLPDPELVMSIPFGVLIYHLAKPLAVSVGRQLSDLVGRELAEDVSGLYKLIKKAVKRLAAYAIPRNRPKTYIFEIGGVDPLLELIARGNDPDLIIRALMDNPQQISDLMERAKEMQAAFGADRVQFLLADEGVWRFNFLTTREGKVIGTKQSYARRAEVLKVVFSECQAEPTGDETEGN
ncbi:MAG: hypothetical protein U0793_26530 [Gemmataceae bacterium]